MTDKTGSERRLTQRFGLLHDPRLGCVVIDGRFTCAIGDLSYGGFSAQFPNEGQAQDARALNQPLDVDVKLLGTALKGTATRVFENKVKHGYAFCHESAAMLIFLRKVLEPMRIGTLMDVTPKEHLKDIYQGPEWGCMRGEGPTDLTLRVDPGTGALIEALLTYREKEDYRSIAFKDGKVSTLQSMDREGVGARMAEMPGASPEILRKGVCLLWGANQKKSALSAPIEQVIGRLLTQLGV